MNVMMLDADGNVKEGRKLTFKMLGPSRDMGILSQAPRLDVIYQGTGPVTTINPLAAASGTPTGNYDACNAGGGTLIQNTFYMDTFVIKAYAPDPTPGG